MDKCLPINWEIGQVPINKKLIKEKTNGKKIKRILFHLFTFLIMNPDCDERSPQHYMIAIMDTGPYKRTI